MANMSKNQTTGKYELNITPSTSTQTKTIKVGGKYSDADISISVSAIDAVLTINGSSPDANGNAQITSIGATISDTMPSSLVQYGNFLKLIKVRT